MLKSKAYFIQPSVKATTSAKQNTLCIYQTIREKKSHTLPLQLLLSRGYLGANQDLTGNAGRTESPLSSDDRSPSVRRDRACFCHSYIICRGKKCCISQKSYNRLRRAFHHDPGTRRWTNPHTMDRQFRRTSSEFQAYHTHFRKQ